MRTFTMTLVGAANLTVAAVLVYFLVRVVLPALSTDETAAAFIPIFVFFVALHSIFGAASLLWHGARARAWFWLAAAVAGVLFLVMFGAEVAFSLSHPADPRGFVPALMAAAAAILIVVGGLIAYLEMRRSATIWSSERRGGWLVAALGGVLIGAALTSWLAGSASASGGAVSESPTTTAVLVAENTTFDHASLSMRSGEVLGLFLVNRDPTAHSFDIDSLGVHVQMPPNSTTAVAITPAAAGAYEYYCAVLGHRDAGMVGTLTIHQAAAGEVAP
jgi:plastocyanin